MKRIVWIVGGVCAAAAGCLMVWRRGESINELAHQLEVGWVPEHHTVVD